MSRRHVSTDKPSKRDPESAREPPMMVSPKPEDKSPEDPSCGQGTEKFNDVRLMYWMHESVICWLRIYWPVFVAIGFMLPRLASAQFGLLDDGVTLAGSRAIIHDRLGLIFTLGGQSGRFSPMILLFYALVYWVGGNAAFFFFCVNAFILAGIAAGLIWIIHTLTGSRIQAWITCLLFVLSGPVVENFYTVTKGEPLQVVWILISFGLLIVYSRSCARWRRATAFVGILLVVFLAISTKETGVVIVPISVAWFLTGLWRKWRMHDVEDLQGRFAYMLAAVMAVIVFFALRAHYISEALTGGTYTQSYRLDWRSLAISASRWLAWLCHDFPYLLPIFVFLIVALIHKRLSQRWILVACSIWMLGWIAVFLPWYSSLDYYLLPFALGCAVFCSLAMTQMLAFLNSTATGGRLRVTAKGCLLTCLVLICASIVNNVTNLRLQLAVDDANAEIVQFLAELPLNSRVAVTLPETSEYFYELGLHLSYLRKRPDILLRALADPNNALHEIQASNYILMPMFENQLFPSIRIGLEENSVAAWNSWVPLRFVSEGRVIFHTERHVQLLDFGLHRITCLFSRNAAVGISCNYSRPFIDTRVCRYGWTILRISQPGQAGTKEGSCPPSICAVS